MNIHYNAEKLQQITEDFSNITGLDIVILDSDYQIISSCYNGCGFCQTIQNSAEGHERCHCSDIELLNLCKESKKSEQHICHAGLTDMAAPIYKNNFLLGYILFGRIRTTEDFPLIYNRISWISGNYEALREEFQRLRYYDESQIRSIANIATAVTAYILSESMLNEDFSNMTEKIIHCIDDNLTRELSVAFLCQKLNISKNILYEHFHSTFNCTVNDYICRKRLEKAKQLLIETDLPVADIVELSGIQNYTYFFRLMKASEGLTPKKFREKYSEQSTGGQLFQMGVQR